MCLFVYNKIQMIYWTCSLLRVTNLPYFLYSKLEISSKLSDPRKKIYLLLHCASHFNIPGIFSPLHHTSVFHTHCILSTILVFVPRSGLKHPTSDSAFRLRDWTVLLLQFIPNYLQPCYPTVFTYSVFSLGLVCRRISCCLSLPCFLALCFLLMFWM